MKILSTIDAGCKTPVLHFGRTTHNTHLGGQASLFALWSFCRFFHFCLQNVPRLLIFTERVCFCPSELSSDGAEVMIYSFNCCWSETSTSRRYAAAGLQDLLQKCAIFGIALREWARPLPDQPGLRPFLKIWRLRFHSFVSLSFLDSCRGDSVLRSYRIYLRRSSVFHVGPVFSEDKTKPAFRPGLLVFLLKISPRFCYQFFKPLRSERYSGVSWSVYLPS